MLYYIYISISNFILHWYVLYCILFNFNSLTDCLIVLSRAENEADSKAIEQQSSLLSNCFFPILNRLQILHKPFANF